MALGSAGGGALLLERAYGRGRIELLADASPLQNRLLASADNAQFGLDAGRQHAAARSCSSSPSTASATRAAWPRSPARWWLAFALLALAGLLWVARPRRVAWGRRSPRIRRRRRRVPRYVRCDRAAAAAHAPTPEQLARALTRLRDAR